jgi:hypothetical protein|tara:strand:+ start:303 stop:1235 length:933 start_codon:yes stop_codon:yes gene_type:complete
MKIIFYNQYNRGDIHYSRGFVNHTVNEIKKQRNDISFFYAHRALPDVISDISDVTEIPQAPFLPPPGTQSYPWSVKDQVSEFQENGEQIVAINAWVGSADFFRSFCGCCFTGNLKLWRRVWKILEDRHDLFVERPENNNDILPQIDYKKYPLTSVIDEHIENTNYEKRIFVSNGPVLSGQSHNFNFDPIVEKLAQENPTVAFYMTDTTNLNLPNVFKTRYLIGKDGCDLNENSYLSRFCDVIVGRGSGPFCFAGVVENFLDQEKVFCSFSHGRPEGFWYQEGRCEYEHVDQPSDEKLGEIYQLFKSVVEQ